MRNIEREIEGIFYRFIVGVIGAPFVGLLFALLIFFINPVRFCLPWDGLNCVGAVIVSIVGYMVVFGIIGSITYALVLNITPARKRPWQSLPVLVLASFVGIVLSELVPWRVWHADNLVRWLSVSTIFCFAAGFAIEHINKFVVRVSDIARACIRC